VNYKPLMVRCLCGRLPERWGSNHQFFEQVARQDFELLIVAPDDAAPFQGIDRPRLGLPGRLGGSSQRRDHRRR